MTTVCYHVQSHTNPQQVVRLAKRIKQMSPRSWVIVSHDNRRPALDVAALERLDRVVVWSEPGGYADYRQIERYLHAVRWLRANGIRYDWFVNLSGQDYPAQHLTRVERSLSEARVHGYLEHFPVLSSQSPWGLRRGRDRYLYKYRRGSMIPAGWRRELVRSLSVLNRMQSYFRINASMAAVGTRMRAPLSSPLWGGGFWCTLSRECVEYAADIELERPELADYMRQVLVPEELFLQTVLVNSGRFLLDADSKRFVDFSATRDNHPRTLDEQDVPAIIESGAHFARKFDDRVHPLALDLIDGYLDSQADEDGRMPSI